MALGLGRPDGDTLLFGELNGSPWRPDQLSWLWRSACKSLRLPMVSFHTLRHAHASALIAAKLDIVQISRRLGHQDPTVTLRTYAHLFQARRPRGGSGHRGGNDANKERTKTHVIRTFRGQSGANS